MYSFGELFASYLSAETLKLFGEVKINRCELNDESRSLNLKLSGDTYIPFSKEYISLPIWAYIPFVILVMLATTNAINLPDGIDGLSTSVTTII